MVSNPDFSEVESQANKLREAGNDHHKKSEFHEAIQEYHRACDLYHQCQLKEWEAKTWSNISLSHLKLEEPEKAFDCAEKALALDPRNAKALYHRAKASELLGQYNECVNDSLSSYKIHPSQEGFQLAVKTAGEHRILIQGIPVDIGYRVCNHKSDKWSSVLIQQAIEKKIFGFIPLLRLVFKADISCFEVVKAIIWPHHKKEVLKMIAAITGHSKYLRKIESTSKVTMVMGAELVQAAIIDIRSQLVDLFLENLDIDGSAIDISNLLSMKTDLRYKPEWLSKILCGIDLQNCEPNPVKFIMESTYEQGDIQLKIIKILLENGASLDFDIPHTTILHLVIKLICKCADTDMGMLHLVCKRFDFSSRTIVDEKGKTPWHIAIETQRTQTTTKICEVLSEYPIDPRLKDTEGKRADHQKSDCDKRVSILRKKEVQLKEEEEKKRAVTKTERKKKRKKKTAVNRSETPKGVAAPHNEPKGESQAAVATHSTSHLKEWHQLDAADTSTACEASGHHDKETENGAFINLVVHDSSIQESIRTHTHDVMFNNYAPPTATVQISANKGCTSERIPKCNITYYLEKLHLCGDDYFQLERAEVAQRPTSPLNSNSGVSQPTPESKVVGATKDKSEESKQAEEFDFQNSVWNIECSKKVMKLLSGKKHKQIKKQFLLKMKWLSQGESWENPKHKKSVSTQKIFELRLNDKERIMWQVVPQFHEAKKSDSGIYKEIIRVWDIVLDHDDIHHHVENIEKIINERSHAAPQETKVKLKCISSGASIEGSIRFPQMFEVCATGSGGLDQACMTELPPPINPEETSYSIARLYSLSDNVVKLMLEDGDIEKAFPYKEWPAEHDIINLGYDESILLLGRSGTGKTTCCLYRMWNEYKHYWSELSLPDPDKQEACDEPLSPDIEDTEQVTPESDSHSNPDTKPDVDVCNHLHQMFVTKNYVLCDRLRKQFCKFVEAERAQHMQMKNMEMSYDITSIDDLSYPLFLTARQFYIMLDYSLSDDENYFFKRDKKGHLTEKIISTDYDHEDIDTLLDFDDSEDDEIVHELYPFLQTQSEMKERREVTSSYFCTHIWKEISTSKKRDMSHMSPVLVWMEIKSFIKGSREAIESNAGFLTKEEYIQLGKKAAPNFKGNREEVYEIFEEYKLHVQNHPRDCLFDECDFIHHLFKRLVKQQNKQQLKFHSIYIDEVQDFTQGELWLMLHNCMNPNRLFLTGDTAQSIMSGIAFRFEEVTTLFYHLKGKLESEHDSIKVVVPKVRHLTVNFRAHSGILELASSVTDILKEYFPHSFDHKNIPQEKGLVSGPKPTLFHSCSPSDIAMVLAGNKQTNTHLDFGAHQAILVRHKKAKDSLPTDLQGAIALTIFESKGLEFDDVLLYNFFTDSDLSDEWRVLVPFTDKMCGHSEKESGKPHHLTFTEEKHKQLCSELKHLYTAITRTKAKLWLYESTESDAYRSILWYWHNYGSLVDLVNAEQLLEAGNSHEVFTSASTPEDWKIRGEEFMQHKLWDLAKKCFQRAELPDKVEYCEAYKQYEHARGCDNKQERCLQFLSAANAFLKCNDIQHSPAALERAAACLYNGQQYENAAWLYKRLSKTERAIKCYTLAKRFDECAKLMEDEHRYADALKFIAYSPEKVRAVEMASQYVKQKHVTRDEIPPSILRYGKELARKYSGEELLAIIDVIPLKLQVQYLTKIEAFDRAAKVLMDLEKYDDAHTLMLTQRMYKEAFNLAKKRHDTKKMQATLLNATRSKLCQCTEERAWHSEVPDIEKELQHMCETHIAPISKGLVYILLSKLTGNDALCQIALDMFQKDDNAHGQCEALVLLIPQAQKDIKFIEKVVRVCILTQKMCSTLRKHRQTATFTNVMLNVKYFYGLTQVKDEQYVLPRHQDVWGLCSKFDHNKPEPAHIHPRELYKVVSDHFERHIVTLMTNESLYKPLTDIMETFEFHGKTMHGPFDHYCNKLDEYLTAYSIALEMTNDCIPDHNEVNSEDMRSFLLNLVRFNGVMMDKKHFVILERFPSAKGILEGRLHSIIKSEVSDIHVDDWMEMWLLSHVMKRDEKELNQITKPVPTHRLDGRSKHFFVSISSEHRVPHFYLWIRFCQLVQEGDKAWIATRVLTNYIETLARRRSLNQHITCVSNTVYILSIATTIYLAFIKLSLPQQTVIVVPKIIVTMMDCFNQMNSSQNCCESLLQSCSKTFKVLLANPQRTTAVKAEACEGLRRILSVFIGVYQENCNFLQRAISNEKQNNIVTCLVLGLTLLGNISLLTSYSSSDLLEYQKQMFSSLQSILKQPNHYLKNVCERFACCQSSRDIFVLVQLLNKMYYGSSSGTNTRDLYNFTMTKGGLNLILIPPDMVPKKPIKCLHVSRPTIEVESHDKACGLAESDATSFERQSSQSSNEGDDELISEDIKQALAYEEHSEETVEEQVERQPSIDEEIADKGFCRVCNISLASDTLSPVLSEHVSSENHKIRESEHREYIQRQDILSIQNQIWEQEIQKWKNQLPESDQLEAIIIDVKDHIQAVEDIKRETEQNGKWREGEDRFQKLQSNDGIEKSIKEGTELVMKPKENEMDPSEEDPVIMQDPGQSDEETLPEMEDVKQQRKNKRNKK